MPIESDLHDALWTFVEWLPEPIITGGHEDPARHAETADSLSLAMLVVLESLDRAPVPPNLTGVRLEDSEHDAHRGGLAGPDSRQG